MNPQSKLPSELIREAGQDYEFQSLKEMPDDRYEPKVSVVNRLKGQLYEVMKILDEQHLEIEKLKGKKENI